MMGTSWIGSAALLAMDITFGATLLLVLAALVVFVVLPRASAAARHLTWLCALGAVLMLPLVAVIVPQWRWEVRTPLTPALPERERRPTPAPPVETAPRVQVTPVNSARKPAPAAAAATTPKPLPQVAPTVSVVPPAAAPGPNPLLPAVLLGLWCVGALLILIRFAARLQALRRFAARCAPYPDTAAVELLEAAAIRLEAPAGIHLLQAPADHLPTGPMTWGVQQPVVVLPAGALLWPPARMRSVLLHEVAHVRRHDWSGYLLANVTCAVYWFHPLVWWAAARLRAESELACDDQVLHAGVPATEYAHALVEIIKTLRGPAGALKVAISMAQGPQIEQRLRAILDPRRRRGSISPAALTVAVVLSAAVAVPAAGVRVRPAVDLGEEGPVSSARPTTTEAVAVRRSAVAWGQPVGGLRAGLEWAPSRSGLQVSEVLTLRVRVRNTGLKPVRLSCLKPSAWDAKLDATGRVTFTPVLQGGGAVPATAIWLAPGKECVVPGPSPRLRMAPGGVGSTAGEELLTLAAGRYQLVAARPLMLQGAAPAGGSLFTGLLPLGVMDASGNASSSRSLPPAHRVSTVVVPGTASEKRPAEVRPVATGANPTAPVRPTAPVANSTKARQRQQQARSRVIQLQQQIAETEDEIADLKATPANSTASVLMRRLEERIAETEEQLIVAESKARPESAQIQELKQQRVFLEVRLAKARAEVQLRGDQTAAERRKRQNRLVALKLKLAEAEDELAAFGNPATPRPAAPVRTRPTSVKPQAQVQQEQLAEVERELLAAESQLADLGTKYGSEHPQMQTLRNRVAFLRRLREEGSGDTEEARQAHEEVARLKQQLAARKQAPPPSRQIAAREDEINAKIETVRQKLATLDVRLKAARARGAAKSVLNALKVEHYALTQQHHELADRLIKTIKARLERSSRGQ